MGPSWAKPTKPACPRMFPGRGRLDVKAVMLPASRRSLRLAVQPLQISDRARLFLLPFVLLQLVQVGLLVRQRAEPQRPVPMRDETERVVTMGAAFHAALRSGCSAMASMNLRVHSASQK